MDDLTLRGSTAYSKSALETWKQSKPLTAAKIAAIVLSVISISFTALLLVHATIRRAPWKRWGQPKIPEEKSEPASTVPSGRGSPTAFEKSMSGPNSEHPALRWKESEATLRGQASNPALRTMQSEATLRGNDFDDASPSHSRPSTQPGTSGWNANSPNGNKKSALVVGVKEIPKRPILEQGVSVTATGAAKPPPKQRIDYLAGLVALASLLVTVIHFGLTFVPALVEPGAAVHYGSETIAQKTIGPLFLTFSWVGIFFTTSTRFLVSTYLKKGDLLNIAEKTVGRTPRLMIPVAAVALLEYFVMNCGGTTWLENLPSVTWSTWPYTTLFPTFGDFVSDLLDLLFLIPNAAPQITFHYCTGILWTIPVQLQGTWTMLLGVIVVREIRTPWKRFAYYFFCIVTNWYARSWGMFLWLGLIITDMDVTYHYKAWIYARPGVHYATVFGLFLVTALGFAPDIAAQWQPWNFSTEENNIHPDQLTGRPIGQTGNAGYPAYFNPRFSALIFVVGFQMMVELSSVMQYILSFPLLMRLFPHILTIYLVHGMIFWTLGSWICVTLAAIGIPYWANLVVVALCCYTALFLSLPVLTPVIEQLGRHITGQVWEFAHRGSAPRRRSLYPFPKDLFFDSANFKKALDGDRAVESDMEKATKIAAAQEEMEARNEQFPRPDDAPETTRDYPAPTLPIISKTHDDPHLSIATYISNNPFKDELDSQATDRDYEGDNHFRKEMRQQRISKALSIGSNNPFRDSFKDELAELDRIRTKESRKSERGYQQSVSHMGNRLIQEIDAVGRQRTESEPRKPDIFREGLRHRPSSSVTNAPKISNGGKHQRSASAASVISLVSEVSYNSNPTADMSRQQPQPQFTHNFPQPPESPHRTADPRMAQRPVDAYQQQNRQPKPPRGAQFQFPMDVNELKPMTPRLVDTRRNPPPRNESPSGWQPPPSDRTLHAGSGIPRFNQAYIRPIREESPDSYSRSASPNYPRTASPNYPRTASPNYPRTASPNYPRTASPNYPRTASPNPPRGGMAYRMGQPPPNQTQMRPRGDWNGPGGQGGREGQRSPQPPRGPGREGSAF
jgi:hypothetical protein